MLLLTTFIHSRLVFGRWKGNINSPKMKEEFASLGKEVWNRKKLLLMVSQLMKSYNFSLLLIEEFRLNIFCSHFFQLYSFHVSVLNQEMTNVHWELRMKGKKSSTTSKTQLVIVNNKETHLFWKSRVKTDTEGFSLFRLLRFHQHVHSEIDWFERGFERGEKKRLSSVASN